MNIQPPLPDIGSGRIFHDGTVKEATWNHVAWLADYEILVTFADGTQLPVSDVNDQLDFVYLAPDSGSQMTNIMVLMRDGEADPVGIPDQPTISGAAFAAITPLYASVAAGDTHPDDLDYCRQLFGSQAAMLRTIQAEGSLDAAHKAVLKNIFKIT